MTTATQPAAPAVDPRRYHEAAPRTRRDRRRAHAGLPLSGDDEPLQSALHHLPAHLCRARAAGRHELGRCSPASSTRCPNLSRAVLHGVGEPMLVKDLPRMVRYLKDRGTYVLFNTNGTLLTERNGRALIEAGLDELRVSLDAADARLPTARCAARTISTASCSNVRAFRALQEREGHAKPRVSAWLTGLKETIAELPDFVRVAAEIGVNEVYLQRLVFFEDDAVGLARPDQALYRAHGRRTRPITSRGRGASRASSGVTFSASGAATEPGMSLEREADGTPWSLCRRPWTVMYFTANGRALPCCIAPFSQRGYENFTLGDATQETLREIWNGPAYADFRDAPCCPTRRRRPARNCGAALEPVTACGRARRRHRPSCPASTRRRRSAGVVARSPGARASTRSSSSRRLARTRPWSGRGAAGARVIVERRRGYGGPCQTGIAAVPPRRGIVLLRRRRRQRPARAASRPSLDPIRAGRADFVHGSRIRGDARAGQP